MQERLVWREKPPGAIERVEGRGNLDESEMDASVAQGFCMTPKCQVPGTFALLVDAWSAEHGESRGPLHGPLDTGLRRIPNASELIIPRCLPSLLGDAWAADQRESRGPLHGPQDKRLRRIPNASGQLIHRCLPFGHFHDHKLVMDAGAPVLDPSGALFTSIGGVVDGYLTPKLEAGEVVLQRPRLCL